MGPANRAAAKNSAPVAARSRGGGGLPREDRAGPARGRPLQRDPVPGGCSTCGARPFKVRGPFGAEARANASPVCRGEAVTECPVRSTRRRDLAVGDARGRCFSRGVEAARGGAEGGERGARGFVMAAWESLICYRRVGCFGEKSLLGQEEHCPLERVEEVPIKSWWENVEIEKKVFLTVGNIEKIVA